MFIIGSNLLFLSKIEKYVNKALHPCWRGLYPRPYRVQKRYSFPTATPIKTFLEGISQHHQGRIYFRNSIKPL